MKTMSISKIVGLVSATLLLTLVIPATSFGDISNCKEGICCHVSSSWNGKKMVKTVSFSGFPRTPQDFVTNFYQIRGLPGQDQQIESRGGPYEISGSADISVQACRRRGDLVRKTFCTRWVAFKVY
jgi:hypothetical protein